MNLKENQKEYWNKAASDKQFTTPFQMESFSRFVAKTDRILDVGCGYGRTLNELQTNGFSNLCGIDFSEKMIERGKMQFPALDLHVQKNPQIDFADDSFDVVILFAVLTCIIDNAAQLYLLNEIKRVLKPNGILYINDFLLNDDERNQTRYAKYAEKYGTYGIFELDEGAVVRHHDLEWVKKSTEAFDQLMLEHIVFTTMNGNKSNGYYYMGKNTK